MNADTAINLIVYGWLIGVGIGVLFVVCVCVAIYKFIKGRK